jgi:hypothetical protein
MDDSELQQLVIGLAAQIYFATRDGKDPYDPEVTAGLSMLVEDLAAQELEWSVEVPRTPQALRAVITECMECSCSGGSQSLQCSQRNDQVVL